MQSAETKGQATSVVNIAYITKSLDKNKRNKYRMSNQILTLSVHSILSNYNHHWDQTNELQYRLGAGGIHTMWLQPHGRTYSSHALNYFLKFFVHIFQGKLQRLESFPNCGRVGNPQYVECIWDCDWIANPLYGKAVDTTISLIPSVPLSIIFPDGLTYNLIKYPQDPTCLQDCSLIRVVSGLTDITKLEDIFTSRLDERPNIDSMIIEICLLYLELNNDITPCLDINNLSPPIGGRSISASVPITSQRLLAGNSVTNNHIDGTLHYTLNQYPWTCSLRTAGYRGRHVCGATLLSAPPSKTIIVSAAHCNYICKSSEGTVRETCCCRDLDNSFASCRTVRRMVC